MYSKAAAGGAGAASSHRLIIVLLGAVTFAQFVVLWTTQKSAPVAHVAELQSRITQLELALQSNLQQASDSGAADASSQMPPVQDRSIRANNGFGSAPSGSAVPSAVVQQLASRLSRAASPPAAVDAGIPPSRPAAAAPQTLKQRRAAFVPDAECADAAAAMQNARATYKKAFLGDINDVSPEHRWRYVSDELYWKHADELFCKFCHLHR